MKKRWPEFPVFAPPPADSDRLAITGFRAWRMREPISRRGYTVVRLDSRGGVTGYGEGGPVLAGNLAEVKSAVAGRRATDGEFIRHRLDGFPALEAAVNNAMLDLTARSTGVPIYQYLGARTGLPGE